MNYASTEAVTRALCAVATEHRQVVTSEEHVIGADQVSRRTGDPMLTATDPDGSLPDEAWLEFGPQPSVSATVYPDGDVKLTVDGVEFSQVPWEDAPAFLQSVYEGLAWVEGRVFPPRRSLVVPVPGDRTYREKIFTRLPLTPWLWNRAR
ncbi:hypothetical protein ACFXKC_42485 [Streptomyces sp. NPDC059340]|uniref:hypothetical protein n=1 Tax=Streptomyces sp. NPDC059340 TaxID=3346806 RepID=UPI003698D91F